MAVGKEEVESPAVPVDDGMTPGERMDMSFGSNSSARRENTIGQEPQQQKVSLVDKLRKLLKPDQRQ